MNLPSMHRAPLAKAVGPKEPSPSLLAHRLMRENLAAGIGPAQSSPPTWRGDGALLLGPARFDIAGNPQLLAVFGDADARDDQNERDEQIDRQVGFAEQHKVECGQHRGEETDGADQLRVAALDAEIP